MGGAKCVMHRGSVIPSGSVPSGLKEVGGWGGRGSGSNKGVI